MTFTAPVDDQRFVLDAVVGHRRAGRTVADSDMVDAILEGAAALAAGEFAPLNRIGDEVGANWDNGAVTMPAGLQGGLCAPTSRAAG